MRLITDNLGVAIGVVYLVFGLFFYEMMIGYGVDPSFISANLTYSTQVSSSPAVLGSPAVLWGSAPMLSRKDEKIAADARKLEALAGWFSAHRWGWWPDSSGPRFDPPGSEYVGLDLGYPDGSHVKLALRSFFLYAIYKSGPNGTSKRDLSKEEYGELLSIFAN